MNAPVILIRDATEDVVAAASEELRRNDWAVRGGWELPADAWGLRRIVCVGIVQTSREAQAAVLAAARGAGLVVGLDAPDAVVARLYEDLRRLGHVELRDPAQAGDEVGELPAELRTLLELLAAGRSLDQAAAELNYSRRTVSRRLASARDNLGVATTAEAIHMAALRRPPTR